MQQVLTVKNKNTMKTKFSTFARIINLIQQNAWIQSAHWFSFFLLIYTYYMYVSFGEGEGEGEGELKYVNLGEWEMSLVKKGS